MSSRAEPSAAVSVPDVTRTANPPTRGASSPRRGKPRSGSGRTGARASTAGRPVGKPHGNEAATFRRRRLTVLALLTVLLVGGFFGIRSAVHALTATEEPLARTAGGPLAPDAVGPTGPPTEWELANPVDCRTSAVGVEVALPQSTLRAGATTRIPVTVTNTGQVPCLLDVGADQLVVTIYSGEDKIWDSRHCRGDSERRILLDTGAADASTVTWHGVRSSLGCPDGAAKVKPGTYRVIATLLDDDGARVTRAQESFTIR